MSKGHTHKKHPKDTYGTPKFFIGSAMIETIHVELSGKEKITSVDLKDVINLMLFGKQQNSKKSDCFSSSVGISASGFRMKATKNTILHVLKEFVTGRNMAIPYSSLKSRPDLKWFRRVVPTSEMCKLVSSQKEKKGVKSYRRLAKNAVANGRHDVSSSDITKFALTHVYSTIVAALNINRKAFKKMFFGRVGYILADWEQCGFKDVSQDIVAMWVEHSDDNKFVRMCEVPEAKTVKEGDGADIENEIVFEKFVRERKEFMITVEHPINIRKNRSTKASSSSTAFVSQTKVDMKSRPFRRTYSLLGIALSMLSDLCGIGNDVTKVKY